MCARSAKCNDRQKCEERERARRRLIPLETEERVEIGLLGAMIHREVGVTCVPYISYLAANPRGARCAPLMV